MKSEISAFMDGELPPEQGRAALVALSGSTDLRSDWEIWHTVGDGLRGQQNGIVLGNDFHGALMARIADEPPLLCPGALSCATKPARRIPYWVSVAASLMGVAAVALVALRFDTLPQSGLAQIARVPVAASRLAQPKPAQVAVERSVVNQDRLRDYVLAHEGANGAMPMPARYQRGLVATSAGGNGR